MRQVTRWCGVLGVWNVIGGCRPVDRPPQHYKDPGAMIDVFEASERDAWQLPERVVQALPLASKRATIADIGAGSGYFTRRLAARVPEGRVYAVDVDGEFENHLLSNREAWGTPNIEPHLAHYDDPMLPLGELDFVFTANTYTMIRDRPRYFSKVYASLKPQGMLAVIDFRPTADIGGDTAPNPQHRVTQKTAEQELSSAGFEVTQAPSFLPHQWFLILRRKP